MRSRGGRWAAGILAAVAIVGLGWCGWRYVSVRQDRETLAEIERAMRDGRYATAARELSALRDRRPGFDRATYLLGLCQKALGRPDDAEAAWAAIPADSPFAGRAVADQMDLLVEQGRLADAERFILQAADRPGARRSAIRMLLIPMLLQEGRTGEAQRLIEERWRALDARDEDASDQAVNLARLHMDLRWNPAEPEALRTYLEQVGRLVPDDDRIWLGRANLALREGDDDQAKKWLDECLKRRPDDPPVWRARLEWALKTGDLDAVKDSLAHLPAASATPAEVHRLSAWLAGKQGDVERQQKELAALVHEAPEDLEARAQVKTETHLPDRAAIERDQQRYRVLHRRHQPARDAEEMARLAERLGHPFEALLWLNAAAADHPALRLDIERLEATLRAEPSGRSLLDRLARAG